MQADVEMSRAEIENLTKRCSEMKVCRDEFILFTQQ